MPKAHSSRLCAAKNVSYAAPAKTCEEEGGKEVSLVQATKGMVE